MFVLVLSNLSVVVIPMVSRDIKILMRESRQPGQWQCLFHARSTFVIVQQHDEWMLSLQMALNILSWCLTAEQAR